MADDNRAALIASAERLGLSPVEWGALMSYESGLNPSIRGGAGGRHLGLIQFGPTEQRDFGVTGRETFAEQLPKAEAFLLSRGYKPGMGLMQAYSTVNAGSPGRLNASDAGNGGLPGTVADKVRDQFGPHYKKAAAFLGGSFTPTMPGGSAASGRFGVSGVEPSAAPAPAMTMPSEAPSEGGGLDAARLMQLVLAQAQPAHKAPEPPAPSAPAPQAAPPPQAEFDAARFYALLGIAPPR